MSYKPSEIVSEINDRLLHGEHIGTLLCNASMYEYVKDKLGYRIPCIYSTRNIPERVYFTSFDYLSYREARYKMNTNLLTIPYYNAKYSQHLYEILYN